MARETKTDRIETQIEQWNAADKPGLDTLPAGHVDAKALVKALREVRIKADSRASAEQAARAQLVRITASMDDTLTLTAESRDEVFTATITAYVVTRAGTIIVDVRTLKQWLELAENDIVAFQPVSRDATFWADVQVTASYRTKEIQHRQEAHLTFVDGRARASWRSFPDFVLSGAIQVEPAHAMTTQEIQERAAQDGRVADILFCAHERVALVKANGQRPHS